MYNCHMYNIDKEMTVSKEELVTTALEIASDVTHMRYIDMLGMNDTVIIEMDCCCYCYAGN